MGSRGQLQDQRMNELSQSSVTQDGFLGGRLTITQPRTGHRSGHDAVLLAAAIAPNGPDLCEFGCGVGVASLCALHRLPTAHVTGVEIDPELGALARQNALGNGYADRFSVVTGDLSGEMADLPIAPASMDHIFFNPPYYRHGEVQPLADPTRQQAHHMAADGLDLWSRRAASFLRAKGQVTVIGPARDLPHLLAALSPRFGDLRLKPIMPRPDAEASRIIITGQRDRRGSVSLLSPLILQDGAGHPSIQAEEILRLGHALALSAAGR